MSVLWSPGCDAIWRMLKMQFGTATARWRCCWMISITLPFVFPGTWSAMNGPENVNSALNQPVRVTPAQATCGFRSSSIALNFENEAVPCAHGCARNFSKRKWYTNYPLYLEEMGGHPCKLPQRRTTLRRKRATKKMTLCYSVGDHNLNSMASEYTYSVWIKPRDTHTEQ